VGSNGGLQTVFTRSGCNGSAGGDKKNVLHGGTSWICRFCFLIEKSIAHFSEKVNMIAGYLFLGNAGNTIVASSSSNVEHAFIAFCLHTYVERMSIL
jgi:hypothetical protein